MGSISPLTPRPAFRIIHLLNFPPVPVTRRHPEGSFFVRFIRRAVLSSVCLIPFAFAASAQITVTRAASPVHLDGLLSEAAWASAEAAADFTQREPAEGAAPTARTEVRVIESGGNLYIGVMCYDSEPDKILHRELKWDTGLAGDDRVTIILDTYRDKRMGYAFTVNPNGARDDASFLSDNTLNYQWDALWEVAARVTPLGWSCEFEIPFKALRFPAGERQEWGINVVRNIRRKNEEALWRGWRRDEGATHLAGAGVLSIPARVESGRQLDVTPYVLAGVEKTRGTDADNVLKAGLDVKYGITSTMTLDLTTKTDFAQVESDKDVINLTRFPIQYTEKREFFLEGLETFDFTQGGTKLFYSRKIGIDPVTREGIPILGGAKLTQKQGRYRVGVMTVQTGAQGGVPETNYSVVRVRRDILEQSYVGFIATGVFDRGRHDNELIGMDFGYKTDRFPGRRKFEVQGYLTASSDDGLSHDNLAGRIYCTYPNDFINWYGLYHAIDANFRPGVGFVSRVGIKNYISNFTISPRPHIPFVRKLVLKPFDINYTTDMDGRLLTRNNEVRPLGFVLNSGDALDVKIWQKYDYVDDAAGWEIFDGTTIPKGVYRWRYCDIVYTGSTSRPVSLDFSANFGGHYNGGRTYLTSTLTFKRTKYYALAADATYNDITVTDVSAARSRFTTREYGGRVSVDLNTRLSSSLFMQYNNESREVTTNVRIHYIPRVGSDLYFVFNNTLDEAADYETERNAVLFKVDYTYRM